MNSPVSRVVASLWLAGILMALPSTDAAATRSSPLYSERLALNTSQSDQPGYVYEGARTMEKVADSEPPTIATPLSGSPQSVCILSGCLGSVCFLSGCVGSVCFLSGCAGSACGGTVCGVSICAGSVCQQSTCFGSVCVGSGCLGSVCVQQTTCNSSHSQLQQNAATYLANVKTSLASVGHNEPLGPGLAWSQVDPVYTSDHILADFYGSSVAAVPGMGVPQELMLVWALASAGIWMIRRWERRKQQQS